MRICFLSARHPPLDKRVFLKEAVSLAQAGFDVLHLAPSDAVEQKTIDGVQVITYFGPQGIRQRTFQILRLYRLARELDADCYHCNEVDSWVTGILLKILNRKLVVFDVHEHYPSIFAESRFPRWLHGLVATGISTTFRLLSPFTDRILLAKQSVAQDFENVKHKTILVRNFTSLASAKYERPARHNGNHHDQMVTAIHLGLFNRIRGWPQLLDAMAHMEARNFALHIVGEFNDGSRDAFEQRAQELGISKRIRIENWMPFHEAYQRLLSADIGLVLFQPGILNHVYAFPHKLFDYMLAELPVIIPDFAVELVPMITQADCGLAINSADPCAIARALDYLVARGEERRRLGHNGRKAVLERYNWEAEAKKLTEMYRGLATSAEITMPVNHFQ